MEVMQNNDIITVIQTIYIDQLLAGHQMSNYNTAIKPIVERLYLTPASNNFKPLSKDIIVYKHFNESIQWFVCQTQPNITQAIAKLSKHNVKPTNQFWTAVVYLFQ